MEALQERPEFQIRYLRGIGPKRAEALERLGVRTLHDLFYFFPRRYEDRTRFVKISEIVPGELLTLEGEVLTLGIRLIRRRPLLFELKIGDDSGMISALWFNQPYLKSLFKVGMKVILSGKAELYKGKLQLQSPEYEILEEGDESPLHVGRIVPIYPLTEGLYQKSMRFLLKEALDQHLEKEAQDPLQNSLRESRGFLSLHETLQEMHFPTSFEKLAQARKRIVFEEFLNFELELLARMKQQKEKENACPLPCTDTDIAAFLKAFPFNFTEGQKQAVSELRRDLSKGFPMNRLLQGEVGSGKTSVAAFSLFLAAKGKKQSAFLVPTEILAEQHFKTLKRILEPFKISVELLTSGTPAEKRESILNSLRENRLSILIGTHALLQETVQFHSLALVVIDEQHKFGVRQRNLLLKNSPRPHLLVMTATPIPRTLALTLYGDLEVSTMRELPPGRLPVKTYWITRKKQSRILEHIRERVLKGEQAYLVFPVIEETENSDLFSARQEFERLSKNEFHDLKLGLVHGKVAREEIEKVMTDFREGKIHVLVATSVIEVGIDNPRATLMVIENAERFGLSQLHQLRGRIGRGGKASDCFLFGEPRTEEGKRRLRILTKTNDGFQIAEEDLRLRGPGELLGVRQSGEPYFRVADLEKDFDLLLEARKAALSDLQLKGVV